MARTIVAALDDPGRADGFLHSLLSFAGRGNARLKLFLLTPGPIVEREFAPFGAIYLPNESPEILCQEQVGALRARLNGAGSSPRIEVRGLFDDITRLADDVCEAQVIADLAVIAAREEWAIPYLFRRTAETLALSSGAPLLILPPGRALTSCRHAVFGWKHGAEAVHALRELISLLEPGARVDVLTAGSKPNDPAHPGRHDAVCAYLDNLGFAARSVWIDAEGGVAQDLQTYALEVGADLLAAGAFAHSRIREVMLGGVTESLISEARLPIFLAR